MRLENGIRTGFITEDVVISLSLWCDSERPCSSGIEPARKVSRALFNGELLRRLASANGVEIRTHEVGEWLNRDRELGLGPGNG